jgi:hypothetical protein
MPLGAAIALSGASSVAGGQMTTVQRGGVAVSSSDSRRTSANEALVPFIFQLPAIRGVIGVVT